VLDKFSLSFSATRGIPLSAGVLRKNSILASNFFPAAKPSAPAGSGKSGPIHSGNSGRSSTKQER